MLLLNLNNRLMESIYLLAQLTHDGARADIRARGFWYVSQDEYFFAVRVFYPNIPSNRSTEPTLDYRKHGVSKETRIWTKNQGSRAWCMYPSCALLNWWYGEGSFNLLQATSRYDRTQRQTPYHSVMGWLRCRLSFASLRSAIMRIRGSLSIAQPSIYGSNIPLATSEGRIPSVYNFYNLTSVPIH